MQNEVGGSTEFPRKCGSRFLFFLVFQKSGTKYTPFPVLYQCLGITEAQLDPLIAIEHDILDRFPVQFRRGVDPHSRPSS